MAELLGQFRECGTNVLAVVEPDGLFLGFVSVTDVGAALIDERMQGETARSDEAHKKRFLVIRAGSMFVLGFIATFVVMGMLLQRFMYLINPYRGLIVQIGGVLFVF